ncbi:hypothetical protein CEXT_9831 [Caerostris extrusa]|uniref:Uncharacterized protein n=1 Tax=Caerostris extrusa TaxID=172846 RepID=A0AAV4YBY6_CAEEX|nr:hypothetical protein CEXT_9831 [Caerostris extrusa]
MSFNRYLTVNNGSKDNRTHFPLMPPCECFVFVERNRESSMVFDIIFLRYYPQYRPPRPSARNEKSSPPFKSEKYEDSSTVDRVEKATRAGGVLLLSVVSSSLVAEYACDVYEVKAVSSTKAVQREERTAVVGGEAADQ